MKKLKLVLFSGLVFFASCTKTNDVADTNNIDDETSSLTGRKCGSMEVLAANIAADPGIADRMNQIEAFTERFVADPSSHNSILVNGVIQIPVVVNVLYRTAAENISDAQIQSQIDVLNEDFKATNADYSSVPALFQPVRAGNVGVSFLLDQVVRVATNKTSWTTNDAMKKSNRGGINPTSPSTKLNLWSCNMGGGILGYAQFPGGSLATDGVVIDNNAFGRTGAVSAPYNKGRTATHEVGHWMNLRHIWGDATCGNDFVGDTPLHTGSNFGCPAYPTRSTCTGTPVMMTMNYMDYTDDLCMYMFSAGQKDRMLATFAVGGPRASFR
jgi:hypothetical protein